MKKIAMLSLLLSFSMPAAFASNHSHDHAADKCTCTHECKENCNKGKTDNCECKDCGCKEGNTCH